jgi:hypothetical protein
MQRIGTGELPVSTRFAPTPQWTKTLICFSALLFFGIFVRAAEAKGKKANASGKSAAPAAVSAEENKNAEAPPNAAADTENGAAAETAIASDASTTASNAAAVAPLAADDGNQPKQEESKTRWTFEALGKEEYRFRYATAPTVDPSILDASGDSSKDLGRGADHDLHFFLGGGMRDLQDRFYVNTSLGIFADIDGFVASGDPSSLSSINENGSSMASLAPGSPAALWFDMYSLYGEYHSKKVLKLARVGRQTSEHGKLVTFDGGALDLRLFKSYLGLFALGGRSVHFFETDENLYEDWLASGGLVIRPIDSLKFELEYRMNAEDIPTDEAMTNGNPSLATDNIVNHTYGITAWYHYQDLLYLKGYFRGIGAAPAETGGIFNLEFVPIELSLDFKIDAQLMNFREINETDDPYFTVLGESLPHVRMNAELKKSFTLDKGIYTLNAGWAARMLTKDEPTAFNRDYGRVYAGFDAEDIVVKGPFLSVVGEFYYTQNSDAERFFTVGGSAGYDGKMVRAEAGTYYNWVKYVYYEDVQEIEDVRTYFVDVKIRPLKWFSISAKYELEQFDRLIHTAMLTLTQVY